MTPDGALAASAPRPRAAWWTLALLGVAAGVLSGFFGVGGGTIIVPGLIFFAGFTQRLAVGTSLAAIVFPAIAGMIGYAQSGSVHWVAGLLLAAGAIFGAQLGSWLLSRLPVQWLRWIFIAFLVVVAVQLFLTVPDRDAELLLTPWNGAVLVVVGVFTGILAGLIGIGGGMIVVPALVLLFGASDLVAKGTSLLMMLPASLSGTVGNARRGTVDLRAALIVGGVAAVASLAGVALAVITPPQLSTMLFALFTLVLIVRMSWHAIRKGSAE